MSEKSVGNDNFLDDGMKLWIRECFTSIFHFSRAYNSENMYVLPHFDKAKMCMRGVIYLIFKLFVYNFQIKS